ncbi:hypothetical protein [Kribbella kalugense]|uniref:Uncharacterized protein n=1 Tax=Kribbella kalugense TaxID=2512221 RepID=A0A4R7ZH12_9ACTN|nr:hypothetical protein [Kribbella kalugense]TDW16977.1 hypothetical protein EV650_3538 [Kribbella kalugense]
MPFSKKGKDQNHDTNQRESNRNRHEQGASRKQADQGRSTNINTERGRKAAAAKKAEGKKKGK